MSSEQKTLKKNFFQENVKIAPNEQLQKIFFGFEFCDEKKSDEKNGNLGAVSANFLWRQIL
jgi:hypothetical protein